MEKICPNCKEMKNINLFSKHKKCKGGYRVKCKLCMSLINKKYRLENKDKIKIRSKKSYQKQKESGYLEKYKKKNKEKLKEKANKILQ